MPIVKVWCLPESSEKKLRRLHKAIVQTLSGIKVLNINGEKDVTCLFPADMMTYGLGTEIIVEVDSVFEKPERTEEVRALIARKLGRCVKKLFPKAELVECFIYSFNPRQGFWSSRHSI